MRCPRKRDLSEFIQLHLGEHFSKQDPISHSCCLSRVVSVPAGAVVYTKNISEMGTGIFKVVTKLHVISDLFLPGTL